MAAHAERRRAALPIPAPESLPLEVAGLTHAFGGAPVLHDISFTVPAGEVACLVGHSGCGKTTLLRLLAGLERPVDGRIVAGGRVLTGPGTFVEPEERGIGFLFQDYALFPHLTVTDNVLFGMRRLPKLESRERCRETLERLGLARLADRFPHALSGGEQQRVALARALAPRPGLLLMDEPFSNLDRGLRDGVRAETLALLRSLGTTVVMVTHDPEEALSAGETVVLMRAGHVVQAGTPAALFDRPTDAYAAEFFAPANRIAGLCRHGFVETPLGRFAAPGLHDGTAATAYLRPHDLEIGPIGSGTGGLEALVAARALRGEIEELRLRVEGLGPELCLRSTRRAGFAPGDRVGLRFNPEHIFVFPSLAIV